MGERLQKNCLIVNTSADMAKEPNSSIQEAKYNDIFP